jgi:hypothetical protein
MHQLSQLHCQKLNHHKRHFDCQLHTRLTKTSFPFLPIAKHLLVFLHKTQNGFGCLITFELNAPHKPLFGDATTNTFFTSRCVVYSPHLLQELQKGFVIVPLIFRHKDAWL